MGLRGPKADPTRPNSRTKSQGNRKTSSTAYGHQQLRKIVAGEPVPPAWLGDNERKIWGEFVPHLFEMGLTHAVDSHMLGAYCMEFSDYLSCIEQIRGQKKDAPATEKEQLRKRADQAFARAKVISDGFGMSHKARVAQGIKMTGHGPGTGEGAGTIGNEAKKAAWNQKAASRQR